MWKVSILWGLCGACGERLGPHETVEAIGAGGTRIGVDAGAEHGTDVVDGR